MIQYTLKCEKGHQTDSWFQSAAAYDALEASGHLSCPVCGSTSVSKALMAPRVQVKPEAQDNAKAPVLHDPANDVEEAMAQLRKKVEENADYVGDQFADEARAMHLGDLPERAIYGEAGLDQARDLIEDGVPVMPLPFRPKQKLT